MTPHRRNEDRPRADLDAVLHVIPDAAFFADREGRIVSVNPAFTRLFGFSPGEVLGHTPEILHADPAEFEKVNPARFLEKGIESLSPTETTYRRANGSPFSGETVGAAIRNAEGQFLGFLEIVRDISRRKAEDECIQRAKEAAEETDRVKTGFVANMSHEIRTPLNGVIGMTELLLNSSLSPEQEEYARVARACAENLLAIVDDILDFSGIEAGDLEMESLDFALWESIEQVAGAMASLAQAKGLTLDVRLDPAVPRFVRGDPGRLRQILLNLVSNAVKFTDRGGVAVDVAPAERTAGSPIIRFRVRDTGIGIDGERLDCLFRPFTQVDGSPTRKHGGTGLGLAICKRLVEKMGGRIGAEGRPGEGSTFWFLLPLPLAPEGHRTGVLARLDSSDTSNTSDGSDRSGFSHTAGQGVLPAGVPLPAAARCPGSLSPRARILIAEDNLVNQRVASLLLEHAGYACDIAATGREAVEALARRRYDLILMDCQMPEMDGYEAARELRRREGGARRTPIVAMTAHARGGDREKCIAAGMDDYLGKPVKAESLYAMLEKHLPPSSGAAGVPPSRPAPSLQPAAPARPAAPAATPSPRPSARPVALERLQSVTAGNQQLQSELISIFLGDMRRRIQALREAMESRDEPRQRLEAHTIKGSSANIGAEPMNALAAAMESHIRNGRTDQAIALLGDLETEFHRVTDFLRESFG